MVKQLPRHLVTAGGGDAQFVGGGGHVTNCHRHKALITHRGSPVHCWVGSDSYHTQVILGTGEWSQRVGGVFVMLPAVQG